MINGVTGTQGVDIDTLFREGFAHARKGTRLIIEKNRQLFCNFHNL
jgi:hypothetical protein